jgi:hypothetical protein
VHRDRSGESGLRDSIAAYDWRREAVQRYPERFGQAADYGWLEGKVRQYSVPKRADFGAFIRAKRLRAD